MKIKKLSALILSICIVASLFSVMPMSAFAVNPAADRVGYNSDGFKFSSDLFEGTNGFMQLSNRINPDRKLVNLAAKGEYTIRRGICSDPISENYEYDAYHGNTDGYGFLCDETNKLKMLGEDVLRDHDGNVAKDGNVTFDIICELEDVASIHNIVVMSHYGDPNQCTGWYALYASMKLEDLDKQSSKIAEFKNFKARPGVNQDNNFQKISLKSGSTAPFAKYVMLRVYWGIDFGSVNSEPNYLYGTERYQHTTRVTLAEFSVYGKEHTHSYEQTAYTAPTCTSLGKKTEYCPVCTNVKTTRISVISHKNKTTTTAATYFAAGKKVTKCSACGETVTTKLAKKTLKKPTAILTAAKKALKVKVNKVTGQTGFQIRYRLKGKSKWTVKTYTGKKTATKTIKLKAKKNYQVGVRAMVKSGSKKAYSAWSKTYTKKTK